MTYKNDICIALEAIAYEPYTDGKPSPSPDYPQELVSVGNDGDVAVTVAGKNLIDFEDLLKAWNAGYTKDGEKYTISHIGSSYNSPAKLFEERTAVSIQAIVKNITATNARVEFGYFGEDGTFVSTTSFNDSINSKKGELINAVRLNYTSSGTFTVENLQVELGTTTTEYEPFKGHTLTVQTPNGLSSIPVTSGGNYTDENGQQWICDEVDFARGVYVQRVSKVNLANQNNWYLSSSGDKVYTELYGYDAPIERGSPIYCTHAVQGNWVSLKSGQVSLGTGNGAAVAFSIQDFATKEELQTWAVANNVTVIVPKVTPVLHELSADELAAYATLHTNYPNTIVLNDEGAGMELSYVADAKTYIDNKFTELQNAIVATGANI